MKGKKIVAAVACTALVAAVAIPFAGCSKGLGETTLDVSNYAEKYSSTPKSAITGLTHSYTLGTNQRVGNYGDLLILGTVSGSYYVSSPYKLVNMWNGTTVASNATAYGNGSTNDVFINGSSLYYIYLGFETTTSSSDVVTSYNLYAYDGTLLISGVEYNSSSYYNNGITFSYNSTKSELTVSGTSATSTTGETVTKTFEVDTESDTVTFTPVTSSASSDGLSVGDTHNSLLKPIYSEDEKVKGDLADYSYYNLGYTYYFYDGNDNLKSTLTTENGIKLGFVGNYMYYAVQTPVDPFKTNGYNYINSISKANYSLHKYDILEDKDSEIKAGVAVEGLLPLYNDKDDVYDAAVIYGSKMNGGVATYGYDKFAYVVDADLNVAYDISWYYQNGNSLSGGATLYSIGNGYYLLGNYVVDSSLTPVNSVGSNGSYLTEGLIRFTNDDGLYGFTDIDGKVVIKAEYTGVDNTFAFYGGITPAVKHLSDGSTQKVLLNKNGSTTVLPDNAIVGPGYYYTVETEGTTSYSGGKYSYYSFKGNLLQGFSNASVSTMYGYGTHMYIAVESGSTSSTAIYKLV